MRAAEKIGALIDLFYVRPLSRYVSHTMFRYAVCGGVNMALDVVWYFIIYHYIVAERFLDLSFVVVSPHVASLVVVFPITFFTGFWLNRNVAFRSVDMGQGRQLMRYALTVVGSILLNYVCIKLFVEVAAIWPTPAKALTTVVSVAYSYLAGRYFTFRKA
ncbi:MAG: GtrA family protein [Rikenellaceae bacterium]|nr:GtrA family protein [Rikenellaceae bacterium]